MNPRGQANQRHINMAAATVLERLRGCLSHYEFMLEPEARINELGLDSLDFVELFCVLENEFQVQLSQHELDLMKTVGNLAEFVASSVAAEEGKE